MKVANPTENIKNPWEAKIKVMNPTENPMENLLEVLYLPEVQNCPLTPMGEREEMVMSWYCLTWRRSILNLD